MGTSASIQIINNSEVISTTQRSDGYPTHVLSVLAHWITTGGAGKEHGLEHNFHSLQYVHYRKYSDAVRKDNTVWDLMGKDALPNTETDTHSWCYVVDLDKRNILVFCNDSFFDPRPENLTSDPLIYLLGIKPEAQAAEKQEIEQAVAALLKAGFTIN